MEIDDRVAQAIQKALNKYLMYQSQPNESFASLHDKVIGFDITTLDKRLFFIPQQDGTVEVRAKYQDVPSAMIKARLSDLIHLALDTPGRSSHAEISGDVKLADKFQRMLATVEFDWEELLVPWIGDAMANEVGKGVGDFFDWGKHFQTSFANNVREYLVDETQAVATADDVETFISEVNELRSAIDRCEAKMKHLGF